MEILWHVIIKMCWLIFMGTTPPLWYTVTQTLGWIGHWSSPWSLVQPVVAGPAGDGLNRAVTPLGSYDVNLLRHS